MDKFFDKKNPVNQKQKQKSSPPDLVAVAKSIEDTSKVIDEIHQNEKKIKDVREKIEKQLGFSNDKLNEYISDSSHFTAEQWKALQKQSKAVKQNITSLGLLSYYRKGNVLDGFLNEGDDVSSQRKRKSKMAGTRRKWIPMP